LTGVIVDYNVFVTMISDVHFTSQTTTSTADTTMSQYSDVNTYHSSLSGTNRHTSVFCKKLVNRWDRRTLPFEPRSRCKTTTHTQFPRNVRLSYRRFATFSAHRVFFDYCGL